MLKYLVLLTGDMMSGSIIIGMLLSYVKMNCPKKVRSALNWGLIASAAVSAVMTVIINTKNPVSAKLNIGYIAYINVALFALFLIGFVALFIFNFSPIQRKAVKMSAVITSVGSILMIFSICFYKLPTVFAYPFHFDLSDNTVLSTDFIYRFLGYLFGIVLSVVAAAAAYKAEKALRHPMHKVLMFIIMAVQAFYYSGVGIQLLRQRRVIPQSDFTFAIIKLVNNYGEYFIIGIIGIVLVGSIYLYIDNLSVKKTEEYSNSAQLRKIKARNRRQRCWSVVLLICTVLAVVNLTVIDAYNNKAPDEAPVEECIDDGDNLVVPYSMVEDGHLHRFGYETDDGITVKFIVVQKPNSAVYGVGLDACDICGDAGYYERDDQIVCRRCDVVMNKNTIGFKGGCNPIVIEYSVENAQIIVPKSTLIEHQNEFK